MKVMTTVRRKTATMRRSKPEETKREKKEIHILNNPKKRNMGGERE